MKKILLFSFFIFNSCRDFSIFEKDHENIFFHENITKSTEKYSGKLKIATYNIQLGFCPYCDPFSGELGGSHEHLDKIAELINTLDFDIVSLQEVGYEYDTSIIENQIKYLAEKTQMNYAYGMNWVLETGSNLFLRGYIGNGILTKYKILNIDNPSIRFIDFKHQNYCLKVQIKLNDAKKITVLNSHFKSGSTNDEKEIQINRLLEIAENETNSVLITGDFNIGYTQNNFFLNKLKNNFSNSLEETNSTEKQAILYTGTYNNGSILDYIFVDSNYNVESIKLAPEKYLNISDHYPYIAYINEL
jgi:endonuclease/exonuclease/phosphatase family metal-dependent hydrolase